MKKIFKFFEQPQEFSGKMCLVIKLKTTKKAGLYPLSQKQSFGKTARWSPFLEQKL